MVTIKNIIQKYPLEKELENYDRKLVQKHRYLLPNIVQLVRATDFTNQDEVAKCYYYLEHSEQAIACKPEEALALLDAEFGDERVRDYAVEKLK